MLSDTSQTAIHVILLLPKLKYKQHLTGKNWAGTKMFLSLITKLTALGTSSSMPQSMICTTPASACSKALDLTIKVSGVPNRSVV